jgi:DNA-binding MarR family transcriptional regulator
MDDPVDGELPAGLGADLGWLLGQALHAHLGAARAAFADVPAGPRGYLVLRAAVEQSAHNQMEMARQLGIDRTVMVYLIDDLVTAGLVERRPDPADRRNRLVIATDAGRSRLAAAMAVLEGAEEQLLAPLTDAERADLRRALRSIAAHHPTRAVRVDAAR